MSNQAYVILSIALVAGAWVWQSDGFQREFRPEAYWTTKAEKAREDIRVAEWVLREVVSDKLELDQAKELKEILDEEAMLKAERRAWGEDLANARFRLETAERKLSAP